MRAGYQRRSRRGCRNRKINVAEPHFTMQFRKAGIASDVDQPRIESKMGKPGFACRKCLIEPTERLVFFAQSRVQFAKPHMVIR